MFTRKRGLFFRSELIRLLNLNRAVPAQQLAVRALLHGNYQPRMLDFARDVMQLHMYLVPHGRYHPAGLHSLLPDSNHTCSHDVTRALKKKKQTSQSEGFSTRAHVLCSSVTCTVHSANRTHRAGHVEFHTRAHVKNPSVPNSLPSLTFVRPRDQLFHRVRFRTGS